MKRQISLSVMCVSVQVLHNNAIADFCRGGWKNSEDVLRTLVNAKVIILVTRQQ